LSMIKSRPITRAECELYLKKSPYRRDPLIRRVLKMAIEAMKVKGVDRLDDGGTCEPISA